MGLRLTHGLFAALLATAAQQAAAQKHGDLLQAPERVEWDAGGLYEGHLADGTPFQIELAYPAPDGVPKDAADVMGNSYRYPRTYTGKALPLAAVNGPEGPLVLAPVLDSGAQGEERLTIALGADQLAGKGTWQAAEGRQQAFTLKRLVLYRAIALTRPSPQAQREGSDRPFVFAALFPVLKDQGASKWVREVAGRCDADLECTNKVAVRWYSKGQLSLDASSSTYGYGAAHKQYRSEMRHYARKNGETIHTRFTAYVAPTLECRQQVSTLLVAKLKNQELSWAEQGALDDLEEPTFIPTPVGIEFHWDPYAVGSYAQGMPSVFLTRAELGACATNLPHPGEAMRHRAAGGPETSR